MWLPSSRVTSDAGDRPHAERLRRVGELERAVDPVVIGQREGRIAELGGPGGELLGREAPSRNEYDEWQWSSTYVISLGRWPRTVSQEEPERRATRSSVDDIVDAICAWHEEARASRIFGMPCVKRSGQGRLRPLPHGDGVQADRPRGPRPRPRRPGAHLFDPSGRGEPFRQWVVVPPEQADEWEALAYEALGQDHGAPEARHHARCVNQQPRSRSR